MLFLMIKKKYCFSCFLYGIFKGVWTVSLVFLFVAFELCDGRLMDFF